MRDICTNSGVGRRSLLSAAAGAAPIARLTSREAQARKQRRRGGAV